MTETHEYAATPVIDRLGEAARAATDVRFSALVRNSRDVTIMADAGGRVVYVSPSVEAVLGWTPEQFATDFGRIVHADDLPTLREFSDTARSRPGFHSL